MGTAYLLVCRTCLALARGSTLVISSLVPDSCKVDRPTIPLRHHLLEQDLTALAWFLHLAPPSSSPGSTAAAQQPFSPPSVATNDSKAPTPSSEAPSIVQELLDCQLLLTGTSDGFLQLHDVDGQLLFKQRLHDSAVRDIQVRPYTSGARLQPQTSHGCGCLRPGQSPQTSTARSIAASTLYTMSNAARTTSFLNQGVLKV
jgi:hypothetical protein